MSTSWQATLMSICIGRGMDGQLGCVLIQLLVILQPSTPCSYQLAHAFNLLCTSLVPGAEEERLVHTDALPVN